MKTNAIYDEQRNRSPVTSRLTVASLARWPIL